MSDTEDIESTGDPEMDAMLAARRKRRLAHTTAEAVLESAEETGSALVKSKTPEYRKAKTRALTRLAQKHSRDYQQFLKEALAAVGIRE
jgi:hypothetical protein